jgi:hypothetical protein
MWIAFGLLFIAAGLLGPRFGFGLFQSSRPGLKGNVGSILANRIATLLIGVLLIAFGLMRFYPK